VWDEAELPWLRKVGTPSVLEELQRLVALDQPAVTFDANLTGLDLGTVTLSLAFTICDLLDYRSIEFCTDLFYHWLVLTPRTI
jgi:hypothetical protein